MVDDKWSQTKQGAIYKVTNEEGPELGYSEDSGVEIITQDGFAFKDLNKNGMLDDYEDWRLPVAQRAQDLASKMTIREIAGLMLYSPHQMIPALSIPLFGLTTYNGKIFNEAGVEPWTLSDQQKEFLEKDHLRHVLVTKLQNTETAVKWNNKLQAFTEKIGLGIPVNNSSDPRHGTDTTKEFNMGGNVSLWPEDLGLAATFDPTIVKRFGEIASMEYRALGITTALSPQVDLGTDPRWGRFSGTFGEDSQLATDMAQAYCDGFQTSEASKEIADGWGYDSVNAMVKHWPGGGSGEGGRDAHFSFGKYAVYPGHNSEELLKPFLEGAFNLLGGTKEASAVMPYYTISYDIDQVNKENVGNSYSKYLITDLLRERYGYNGVVCTDWHITSDHGPDIKTFSGKCWGMETESIADRHYKILMAGVDQFGGNNDADPIVEAYEMGVKEHGEAFMRQRFELSAVRLLKNIFRVGLFENPYLDLNYSEQIVMNDSFINEGREAQQKSMVLVKNVNKVLPIKQGTKLYIPKRYTPKTMGWFGNVTPEKTEYPIDMDVVKEYFDIVDKVEDAACAVVIIRGPVNVGTSGGYDEADLKKGENGYVPISLQYRPYTAEFAREVSIAGGDPLENFVNRSYKGKTVTTYNEKDLEDILETRKAMGDKPVVVVLQLERPAIVSEFEPLVDSILIDFGVESETVCQLISGVVEPSGLLPMQMPIDMKTVEEQQEDVAHDMICYKDSEEHVYDFGFGMTYTDVIQDERTLKYCKK